MAYPTNYNGALNPNSVYNLIFNMIISQYVIKFIFAAMDTPFFYYFTRNESGR